MRAPLLFDLYGRVAVVVGLGKLGLARAKTLADYGCQVVGVDPIKPKTALPKGCQLTLATYQVEHLEDAFLVVAATDDKALNRKIVADAKALSILVNAVDNPADSDFIFPAVIRRGDLTLSVCTDGASPSLTAQIRKELEQRYDESYAERLRYLKALRQKILGQNRDQNEKRLELLRLSKLELAELIKEANDYDNCSGNPGKSTRTDPVDPTG